MNTKGSQAIITQWANSDAWWLTPNLNADPLFCDPENGDYSLAANSPCLPDFNEWQVLVGALGEGCAPVALNPQTWARVKAKYR